MTDDLKKEYKTSLANLKWITGKTKRTIKRLEYIRSIDLKHVAMGTTFIAGIPAIILSLATGSLWLGFFSFIGIKSFAWLFFMFVCLINFIDALAEHVRLIEVSLRSTAEAEAAIERMKQQQKD